MTEPPKIWEIAEQYMGREIDLLNAEIWIVINGQKYDY